jgi:hypothetical protein
MRSLEELGAEFLFEKQLSLSDVRRSLLIARVRIQGR